MGDLIKVRVTVEKKDIPILRQSPGGLGIWKNCQFIFDGEISECDYWVVIDNLGKTEIAKCSRANTLLLTGEPPSKKTYPEKFTRQFGQIITCIRDIQGPNVTYTQNAIPWNVGRKIQNGKSVFFSMNYDDWSAIQSTKKTKNLSVIVSSKTITEGQRQRLAFVEKLKEHFKDRIDVFGVGFDEISDKWDAIADYRYHIVLENCAYPDYWTEKLSDCYLGLTFPIYYGCPNMSDYFPDGSYEAIDILDVEGSIKKIEALLDSDLYQTNSGLVKEARDLVLNRYNFFPLITDFINTHYSSEPKRKIILNPQKRRKGFSFKRFMNEFIHWIVITKKRIYK